MAQVIGCLVLALTVVGLTYTHVCEIRSERRQRDVQPRRLDDVPLRTLVLFNISVRLLELKERGVLIGDALIDRVRSRWDSTLISGHHPDDGTERHSNSSGEPATSWLEINNQNDGLSPSKRQSSARGIRRTTTPPDALDEVSYCDVTSEATR
jgi:hypothetical protein